MQHIFCIGDGEEESYFHNIVHAQQVRDKPSSNCYQKKQNTVMLPNCNAKLQFNLFHNQVLPNIIQVGYGLLFYVRNNVQKSFVNSLLR